MTLTALSRVCQAAAQAAARLVREMREELVSEDGRVAAKAHKSSAVDPVTAVDLASERFLQHFLLTALPDSSLLGEEEGKTVNLRLLAGNDEWDPNHPGVSAGRRINSSDGIAVEEGLHTPSGKEIASSGFEDGTNHDGADVTEGGSESVTEDRIVWVVDPIDGTVNFMYGQPDCAVSIAATVNGVPVAAAVAQVPTGTTYIAQVGGPARRIAETAGADDKDQFLKAPSATELASSLVATGFGYVAAQRRVQAHVLTQLLPRVRDIRRAGSAALDLCHLAEGIVDAYYEHGLGPWDYAAGSLIAVRSGVELILPSLDCDKAQQMLVAGAKGEVLPKLLQVLGEAGAGGDVGVKLEDMVLTR